jgi:hypothetical protein
MVYEVDLLICHASERGIGGKESNGRAPLLSWKHEVDVVRQARYAEIRGREQVVALTKKARQLLRYAARKKEDYATKRMLCILE